MLLKWIFMIIGLLLVWAAFRLPRQAGASEPGMIQTEGRVVGQSQERDTFGSFPVDVFEFSTRDGQLITGRLSGRSQYRVGDHIVVCYDPVTPAQDWGIVKMSPAWTTYALAALGLLLLVAGCVVRVSSGR